MYVDPAPTIGEMVGKVVVEGGAERLPELLRLGLVEDGRDYVHWDKLRQLEPRCLFLQDARDEPWGHTRDGARGPPAACRDGVPRAAPARTPLHLQASGGSRKAPEGVSLRRTSSGDGR